MKLTRVVDSFPSVTLESFSGGLPVEVSLIAQLGHGAGDHLYNSVFAKQQHHQHYVDELEEPSTKLSGVKAEMNDMSSLYSFTLGAKGHPFHSHKGQRIFTAVSGSGGTQLRFSTASNDQIQQDPHQFIEALRFINIPPDCMFTVRFGSEAWHQFMPRAKSSLHPTLFALSCHPNELESIESAALKEQISNDDATIPSLTELLPPDVMKILNNKLVSENTVPTTTLSLDAQEGTLKRLLCNVTRCTLGLLRGTWSARVKSSGYLSHKLPRKHTVTTYSEPAEDSLLLKHLADKPLHHQDSFRLGSIYLTSQVFQTSHF